MRTSFQNGRELHAVDVLQLANNLAFHGIETACSHRVCQLWVAQLSLVI